MVSRYLVDVILIIGLTFGTLGVFYLATGLLGKNGAKFLRALAILGMALLTVAAVGVADIYVDAAWRTSLGSLLLFIGALVALWTIVCVIQFSGPYADDLSTATDLFVDPAVFIVCLIFIIPLGAWYVLFRHYSIFQLLVAFVAVVASGVFITVAIYGSIHLDDRRLQLIGLYLTLLGIATQFTPPVLDLLNVKVG